MDAGGAFTGPQDIHGYRRQPGREDDGGAQEREVGNLTGLNGFNSM